MKARGWQGCHRSVAAWRAPLEPSGRVPPIVPPARVRAGLNSSLTSGPESVTGCCPRKSPPPPSTSRQEA